MKKAILGTKLGMTQVFAEDGKVIPVTVVAAGPCVVVQKKTVETDGYEAVQVGFGEVKEKSLNKPKKGHFAKADVANKKYLKEFRLDDCTSLNVGDEIKADAFEAGEKIDVTGISKGKGFAGPMKRRVMKGKKLPGHMGVAKVTVQNLEIVRVDAENNLILLKGAVPGVKGGLVTIRNSVKA